MKYREISPKKWSLELHLGDGVDEVGQEEFDIELKKDFSFELLSTVLIFFSR